MSQVEITNVDQVNEEMDIFSMLNTSLIFIQDKIDETLLDNQIYELYESTKQIGIGTLLQILNAINTIITTIGNFLGAIGNLPNILLMLLPLLLLGALGLYFIIRDIFNAFKKKRDKDLHHQKPVICSCQGHKHHSGSGWKSVSWKENDDNDDTGWNFDKADIINFNDWGRLSSIYYNYNPFPITSSLKDYGGKYGLLVGK